MDLIDRQAALSLIRMAMPEETSGSLLYQSVKQLPAIDTVRVIRCKDCKHYTVDIFNDSTFRCCEIFDRYLKDDNFCSFAERKDDETD